MSFADAAVPCCLSWVPRTAKSVYQDRLDFSFAPQSWTRHWYGVWFEVALVDCVLACGFKLKGEERERSLKRLSLFDAFNYARFYCFPALRTPATAIPFPARAPVLAPLFPGPSFYSLAA